MYFAKKTFLLIIFFSILSSQLSALALENDLGSWTNLNLQILISKKVLTRFQVSPRFTDNITDFNQLITHGALGYTVNDHLSIWQGYAWSTTYIPNFRREQRLYNDLIYEGKFKSINLENRFRLDERFLQDIEGLSLRARYRLKGMYPLDKNEKWKFVFFDEIFVNCNSHYDGPQAGLDQNRVYVGLNRKINEHFNIDGGYQLQHQHRVGKNNDRLNHFIMFNLNFVLGQLLR